MKNAPFHLSKVEAGSSDQQQQQQQPELSPRHVTPQRRAAYERAMKFVAQYRPPEDPEAAEATAKFVGSQLAGACAYAAVMNANSKNPAWVVQEEQALMVGWWMDECVAE